MSTAATAPRLPRLPVDEGDIWRLSVDRYERMVAAGLVTSDDRVELLEGILVPKMSKSPDHRLCVLLVCEVIRSALATGWHIQSEQPIRMDDSEPGPDVAVIRGAMRDYPARHPIPTEVPLIIEVADSSLRRDREDKRRIYARNAIAVYWIVNVADRVIEVLSNPSGPVLTPDYATSTTYRAGDAIPIVLAGNTIGTVSVNDLLP